MKTVLVAVALFFAYVQAKPFLCGHSASCYEHAQPKAKDPRGDDYFTNYLLSLKGGYDRNEERNESQDVLEISKSNMIFKCQVSADEDTPGKLASNC